MAKLETNMGSNLAAKFGYIQTYSAGEQIWRGGLVVLRLAAAPNGSDNKVYAAVEDVPDTYKQLVLGIAMEAAKGVVDPTVHVPVRVRQDGKFKLSFPGLKDDLEKPVIGRLACVVDDNNVQLYDDTKGNVVVGRITEKTLTAVFVDLGDRPLRLATDLTD